MIDYENDWPLVELSRWQIGYLPVGDKIPPLDISLALRNIATGIENGCKNNDKSNMITPFNLVEILNFLAKFEYDYSTMSCNPDTSSLV